MTRYSSSVHVVLPLPFAEGFDYLVPEGEEVERGQIVLVPFGKRKIFGVVWNHGVSNLDQSKLKPILHCYPFAPLADEFLHFLEWAAAYTLSPIGNILKMVLPLPDALEADKPIYTYRLNPDITIRITPQRQTVIDFLNDGNSYTKQEIQQKTSVSNTIISGLIKSGALIEKEGTASPLPPIDTDLFQTIELSGPQQKAADSLKQFIQKNDFSCSLLDGVTGSGKTEVYFAAIESILKQPQGQVLVLLPEIALTTQFLSRFKKHFGFVPDLWHSSVSKKNKRSTWRRIMHGDARVIVGARSALFLPYQHLKLLIIDEEHDHSYKQEEGVIYHARDLAITRAFKEHIPIILASATPSLETFHNAEQGKYHHVHLPSRFGNAQLPDIHMVDLCKHKPAKGKFLSAPLIDALSTCIAQEEQALLFLNRRGYAPLTLCNQCGHRLGCPDCATWLVEHKRSQQLCCHHCGYHIQKPSQCPECHAEESLIPFGPGVERINEEIKEHFPDVRVRLLTSDTMQTEQQVTETIQAIANKEIDILIGTQILAKGHDFPNLTLVGIIDAECGMSSGDLRAAERTYQLLHQVSGRAGRRNKTGHVYIQTYQPDNPLIHALLTWDRESFFTYELEGRELTSMPPYTKLGALIISGSDERQVSQFASQLVQHAPPHPDLLVLGPSPAPIGHIRKKFRYRILLKAPKQFSLQNYLQQWLSQMAMPKSIQMKVDMDPQQFY